MGFAPRAVPDGFRPAVPDGSVVGSTGGLTGAALWLGTGSAAANVLAYAMSVVLARATGPAVYSELAALVALGLIGNVPATALQLVVARRTAATAAPAAGGSSRDLLGLRAAALTGGALLALCVALSPVMDATLDLHGLAAPVALGLTLVPQTVTGALYGDLLGRERFGGLATAYVLAAAGRLAAAGTVGLLGGSVTEILLAIAAASVLTTGLTALLCGLHRPLGARLLGPPPWRELAGAGAVTAGVLVLTNVDVLMARALLRPADAGAYAVGSLFAKAAFWAPHFLTVLVFPRLAAGHDLRHALVRAGALTVGIGAVVLAVTAAVGRRVIGATSGADYLDHPTYVVPFAVLGVLFALGQLLLLSSVAVTDRRAEVVVWAAIVMEIVGMLLWHGSGAQIIAVATVTTLLLVGAGLGLRRHDLSAAT